MPYTKEQLQRILQWLTQRVPKLIEQGCPFSSSARPLHTSLLRAIGIYPLWISIRLIRGPCISMTVNRTPFVTRDVPASGTRPRRSNRKPAKVS
jgi:hypothetical protein